MTHLNSLSQEPEPTAGTTDPSNNTGTRGSLGPGVDPGVGTGQQSRKETRRAATRFRAALDAERRSAALYRGLAEAATGERREILLQLAAVEERHAGHWVEKLRALGEDAPGPGGPGLRTRLLSWLARRFSVDAVLPILERAEHADAGLYADDPDAAPGMAADERSHGRVLTRLREQTAPAEAPGRSILRGERWHRGDRSGALRAAVFGVNDGLVSNTALVMGFAGSGAAGRTILFAGLAGLLAGAFSMAAGEYISMTGQREAYQREIALEADELRDDPEAEAEELALIYRAKGQGREVKDLVVGVQRVCGQQARV
jgi:hypothetical protein